MSFLVSLLRKAKLKATVETLAAGKKDGARMRLTVNARDAARVGRALTHVR